MNAIDTLTQIRSPDSPTTLTYANDGVSGIRRMTRGRGFSYIDVKGNPIWGKAELTRIRALAIPPAWTDVWINPDPNGHIQATGRDEKRRKQYIYHTVWNTLRQTYKFDHLISFGDVLPEIRHAVETDMRGTVFSRERILATIIWLLENTYIRIGNDEYVRANGSFGLTTIRSNHVSVSGSSIRFSFTGKSGKFHAVEISHPAIARTIRKLEELPGLELFQYMDDSGDVHDVSSEDVNDYLHHIGGAEVTAKDFRTWGGTVLAGITLEHLGLPKNKTERKKNLTLTAKTVARHLRNTPAVSRSYYIHPAIPRSYEDGILIPHMKYARTHGTDKDFHGLSPDEYAIHELITHNP